MQNGADGRNDSSFLLITFLVLVSFWLLVGGILYVTMKGIGHDTQECARDERTPHAEVGRD